MTDSPKLLALERRYFDLTTERTPLPGGGETVRVRPGVWPASGDSLADLAAELLREIRRLERRLADATPQMRAQMRPRGFELAHRLVLTWMRQPDGAPRFDPATTITADGHWFTGRAIRLGRNFAIVLGRRAHGRDA